MSSATSVRTANYDTRVPWTDVLLSAIAAVSWALIGMAGTAALGLHLLGADATGSLGPMTAAVVALGAGGSVTPTGDVSAFGLTGAQATTAVTITPLGVSLVGALLLSYFFLRSLRAAGVVIAPAELLARAGSVIALFVAMLGGLAWAGHDVITIDGSKLGLDKLTGGGGGNGGGVSIPGLGDIGDIGGLLPGKISDLVKAKAAVGFTVDTAPTLLGGLGWSAGILLIALLASRRTPLPRGWEAVHRVVRPAASALVTVLLVAVAAGLAAAAYAAIGDDHPKRIAGAALLGAPNGVWLGIPIGLFVPWDGKATGELAKLLPHPLDQLLSVKSDQPVTLGRLAELDGRVWLLGVAAALMMLLAGVLTAVRTPVGVSGAGGRGGAGSGNPGALGFAGRCAVRLGIVTALTLPLLAWLTDVSVDASLSVLGFDAFGAGIELHGHLGMALVLGAVWGAGAGGVGGLLAYATGAAGRQASRLARGDLGAAGRDPGARSGTGSGPGSGSGSDAWVPGQPGYPDHAQAAGGAGQAGHPESAGDPGPYVPSSPYRAPNPATNPYLQLPDELRQPEDGRPSPRGGAWPGGESPGQGGGAGPGRAGSGGAGPGGSGTGDAGAGGGAWSGGPRWSPDAGSPQEGVWPPGAGSPRGGDRPPAGGSRPGGTPQPPRNAGQFGAGPGPGAVRAGGVGPYSGSSQPPGVVPPDDGTRPHDGPQSPGIPPPPADMYGAPTMAQSYEPPSRSRRRRPGAGSRDWPEDDSDGGQQPPPPPPPPAPPPPGKPKGRR
ncbi:streptophobe family protein [Streptomyces sp. N50]|uniref:streptophobe family protein n=1 Tax=Streptomyces sp. N50 TaxID=3081765 RepID=UPI0029622AC8|nr:streptophobe family protein [Streptomyces sp. N50]WOX08684.1 streptophobe family protein [Streptomyces sp. N50]